MPLVLITYLHYLALAGLFAALAAELALFRPRCDGATARRLARVDAVYGLSALVALGTGLLRVFAGDKTAAYYGANPLFHVKVTLFVVALALSVYPTLQFLKHRRAAAGAEVAYPGRVAVLMRVQILVLLAIPLLAVLMSRGYGYGG